MRVIATPVVGTVVRQVVAIIASIGANIFIIRMGGAALAGHFAAVVLVANLVSAVLGSGISSTTNFFIAGQRCTPAKALAGCFWLAVLYSIVAVPTALAALLSLTFAGQSLNVSALTLGSLICFLNLLNVSLIALLAAYKNFTAINILSNVQPLTFLLFVGFGGWTRWFTLFSLLAFLSVSHLISTVILLFTVAKILLASFASPPSTVTALAIRAGWAQVPLPRMIKFAIPAQCSTLLALLNYRADLFIITAMLGAQAMALYLIAAQIAERLSLFSSSLSYVLGPTQASTYASGGDAYRLTLNAMRVSFLVDLMMSVAIFTASPLFLGFTYGARAGELSWVLGVLLLSCVVNSPSRLIAGDLAAQGIPIWNTATGLAAVVTNIVLNVVLLPRFGLYGAAIATLVSAALNLGLRITIWVRTSRRQILLVHRL